MSVWITDSVGFLGAVASLLTSPAIFNIVGCLILLFACKCFKSLVGG